MKTAGAGPVHEALLLVGGQSTRMETDKALLAVHGVPLWQHQWKTLKQTRPARLRFSLAAHQALPVPEQEVVRDPERGAGPLSGLSAGLRTCQAPRLLVLAVDLPFMTSAYLLELLRHGDPGKGVIPTSRSHFEPLAAIYPIALLPMLDAHVQRRQTDLQSLIYAGLSAGLMVERIILSEEEHLFRNLNTPEDWERAQHLLA